MVDQPTPGTAGEIPDMKKPDLQILFQDLAQSRRDVFEERRNTDRMVTAERERALWEIAKCRVESNEKIRGLERENEAIVRALGRLQGEVDRMREETSVLRAPHHEPQALDLTIGKESAAAPLYGSPVQPVKRSPLGGVGGLTKVIMGASEPPLGKTVPIDPSKL